MFLGRTRSLPERHCLHRDNAIAMGWCGVVRVVGYVFEQYIIDAPKRIGESLAVVLLRGFGDGLAMEGWWRDWIKTVGRNLLSRGGKRTNSPVSLRGVSTT